MKIILDKREELLFRKIRIFFKDFNTIFSGKLVGVTGTRGKTTTVHWTNHFLHGARNSIIAGNSPQHQFLKVLDLE